MAESLSRGLPRHIMAELRGAILGRDPLGDAVQQLVSVATSDRLPVRYEVDV